MLPGETPVWSKSSVDERNLYSTRSAIIGLAVETWRVKTELIIITILWGALWIILYFFLLQLVIPTLKSHAATRHVTTRTCPLWTDISRRSSYFSSLFFFAFRFRAFCVVFEFHSSHSFAISPWIAPHFRTFIAKIRQVLTSLISPFASFRACCVVVESHSSHSFANFAVFYSSFS